MCPRGEVLRVKSLGSMCFREMMKVPIGSWSWEDSNGTTKFTTCLPTFAVGPTLTVFSQFYVRHISIGSRWTNRKTPKVPLSFLDVEDSFIILLESSH